MKYFFFNYLIPIVFLFFSTQSLSDSEDMHTMAIIGDSATTGAVADPKINVGQFDEKLIKTIFKGSWNYLFSSTIKNDSPPSLELVNNLFQDAKMTDLSPPTRIWWKDKPINYLDKAGTKSIDYEQYSWGYLLGRRMGIHPVRIFMTGRDGERSTEFKNQAEALLEYTGNELPEYVFIQFTGNDLCRLSVFEETDEMVYQRIYKAYREGFRVLMKGTLHPFKTQIYVLPYMDIAQVIDSEEVLQSHIAYRNKVITCQEFRTLHNKPTLPFSQNCLTLYNLIHLKKLNPQFLLKLKKNFLKSCQTCAHQF